MKKDIERQTQCEYNWVYVTSKKKKNSRTVEHGMLSNRVHSTVLLTGRHMDHLVIFLPIVALLTFPSDLQPLIFGFQLVCASLERSFVKPF